jgi:hypothetical protein
VDVVDLRADGESADETDYATCQMCGNEKIRYVHPSPQGHCRTTTNPPATLNDIRP